MSEDNKTVTDILDDDVVDLDIEKEADKGVAVSGHLKISVLILLVILAPSLVSALILTG